MMNKIQTAIKICPTIRNPFEVAHVPEHGNSIMLGDILIEVTEQQLLQLRDEIKTFFNEAYGERWKK